MSRDGSGTLRQQALACILKLINGLRGQFATIVSA
jgi:hypothetical protein